MRSFLEEGNVGPCDPHFSMSPHRSTPRFTVVLLGITPFSWQEIHRNLQKFQNSHFQEIIKILKNSGIHESTSQKRLCKNLECRWTLEDGGGMIRFLGTDNAVSDVQNTRFPKRTPCKKFSAYFFLLNYCITFYRVKSSNVAFSKNVEDALGTNLVSLPRANYVSC